MIPDRVRAWLRHASQQLRQAHQVAGAAPRRGMLAVACLPEGLGSKGMTLGYLQRGDCPGGAEPVLKPVAAAAGDTVDVTAAGVSVNGVPAVPPALAQDSRGHAAASVPPGRYPVPEGAV